MDNYLKKKVDQYDKWMGKGGIRYASRVVPVAESLEAREWVMPGEQALEILSQADTVAVQDCECRSRYQRCDHPREVCFLLNQSAQYFMKKSNAREVDLDQAREILKIANQAGLVHLTLYKPDQEIFALCSCCSCCCHDFQIIREMGKNRIMARSDFRAETRALDCTACGACLDRCPFQARRITSAGELETETSACLGCGLCVSACPEEAIAMVRTHDDPPRIPDFTLAG